MTKLDKLLEQQKEIQKEIDKERGVKVENVVVEKNNDEVVNKYMIMPFVDFAILSTLMIVFFPWSLLFCVLFYGLEETKYIVLALFHDFIKTILAILSIVVPIIILVILAVVLLSS